jgi:hypothetical protein
VIQAEINSTSAAQSANGTAFVTERDKQRKEAAAHQVLKSLTWALEITTTHSLGHAHQRCLHHSLRLNTRID